MPDFIEEINARYNKAAALLELEEGTIETYKERVSRYLNAEAAFDEAEWFHFSSINSDPSSNREELHTKRLLVLEQLHQLRGWLIQYNSKKHMEPQGDSSPSTEV